VHAFYFREASRSFRQHRGLTITAMFSLTAVLTLSGVFLLLSHNADNALKLLGDRREMVVYLRDNVDESERAQVVQSLERLYGTVTYVSKEQAWEEFSQQIGDRQLLDAVDQNPLPASLRVKLRPELLNYDAMDEAAQQVAQFPEVEDVRYGAEWVRRLDQIGTGLHHATLALGLVVALAIVFVVYNTIRLTVLARRPQVEIMSRLGATDRFIAAPFTIEAVLQTGVSAVISLGLVFAVQQMVRLQVGGVTYLPIVWLAAFVAIAIALAWLASWLALSRVLRTIGP
jgi:cell division transport system permease protein